MENALELLRLFVQALALFATSLDRWFQIPWPLVLAAFFPPMVAALDVVVWYLRGMTFPIPCGYLRVHGRGRCRRVTLGEWHKCWYHRQRRLRRTDKHLVDPDMRRWKTRLYEDDTAEIGRVAGSGFLRMRSRRDSLLYHQGFTRPPRDVFKILPSVFQDYKSRALERWANFRSLGLRGLIAFRDRGSQYVVTSDVLPGVIYATRLTLVIVALGLVLVGISKVVPNIMSVTFEYLATFSFIFALAVTRAGIWRANREWLAPSARKSAKWIFSLMLVATFTGLVGLYADEVKNAAKTIVETVFAGLALLVALYVSRFGTRRRRRR